MDVVEEQVKAYNARDIERFLGCYAPDVVVIMGDDNVMFKSREEMRGMYNALFEASSKLHCHIANRIRVGKHVVDEEEISGAHLEGFPSEMHGIAIYTVEDNIIVRMRMYM